MSRQLKRFSPGSQGELRLAPGLRSVTFHELEIVYVASKPEMMAGPTEMIMTNRTQEFPSHYYVAVLSHNKHLPIRKDSFEKNNVDPKGYVVCTMQNGTRYYFVETSVVKEKIIGLGRG